MREIKFRGYKEKHFGCENCLGDLHEGCTELCKHKVGTMIYDCNHKLAKGWVVMQFTGVSDQNGKEIYEGDILANRKVHGDNFYCVVEYQRDGFKGVTVPHRNHCRSLHNMMTDEGAEYNEVIGNIYENSDLLDKLSSKGNV